MSLTVKPTARKDEIVIQEADHELLVYDLRTNKALCLNQLSAAVWNKCDGLTSIKRIKEELAKETHSAITDELVWLALDQLEKEKLLENFDKTEAPFAGLSRREMITKVGLGTAITLPMIASIVAPAAVHAQSAGLGCSGASPNCMCLAANCACTIFAFNCAPPNFCGTSSMCVAIAAEGDPG